LTGAQCPLDLNYSCSSVVFVLNISTVRSTNTNMFQEFCIVQTVSAVTVWNSQELDIVILNIILIVSFKCSCLKLQLKPWPWSCISCVIHPIDTMSYVTLKKSLHLLS